MPYPCVACGFLVFDEPPGSYAICSVCGWEDDHVQFRFPASPIGANHLSLYDWQRTIALPKAPLGVEVLNGFPRAAGWRPLRAEEAPTRTDQPQSGRSYFEAATADNPPYYWEDSGAPAS